MKKRFLKVVFFIPGMVLVFLSILTFPIQYIVFGDADYFLVKIIDWFED